MSTRGISRPRPDAGHEKLWLQIRARRRLQGLDKESDEAFQERLAEHRRVAEREAARTFDNPDHLPSD